MKTGFVCKEWNIRPWDIQKTDSEYIRKGTSSIFVFTEVLAGWRHVSAREHRAAIDWAEEICYLPKECYPDKEKIVLVMDNLNTHVTSSLCKRYSPEKARALAKRLAIHYTPKHGSWQFKTEDARIKLISLYPKIE